MLARSIVSYTLVEWMYRGMSTLRNTRHYWNTILRLTNVFKQDKNTVLSTGEDMFLQCYSDNHVNVDMVFYPIP